MAKTADEIMVQMGFTAADQGPNVTALRASIERQVRDHGLAGASYGSWVGNPDAETRAKAHLGVEWAIQHGHSCRIEHVDSRRHFGDLWRRFLMNLRIWRDVVLMRSNPFAD